MIVRPSRWTAPRSLSICLRWRSNRRGRAPLGVVQRLDRVTSGLLVFARTFAAKKHLGNQLRLHTMTRRYLAIAHGDVSSRTCRSFLIEDRGDHFARATPFGPEIQQDGFVRLENVLCKGGVRGVHDLRVTHAVQPPSNAECEKGCFVRIEDLKTSCGAAGAAKAMPETPVKRLH